MRNGCVLLISGLLLGSVTVAFAHGTAEKSKKKLPTDSRMIKLHAMMPVFSVAAGKLEAALEKADAAAAEAEAAKIVAALPDLRRLQPGACMGGLLQRDKYRDAASM